MLVPLEAKRKSKQFTKVAVVVQVPLRLCEIALEKVERGG